MSELGAEGEQAWTDLSRHLEWAEGSWLCFVFTRSTAAVHELQRRVRDQLGGRPDRVLRPRTPQQLRELLPLLLEPSGAAVTWVEAVHLDPGSHGDPGPWVEAWDWFLLRTNERREGLMRALGGGLIFAAPDPLKHRFREAAPDLWSIRALVIAPDLPPPPPVEPESRPTLEVDALLAQGWISEAAPLAEEALARAEKRLSERPVDRRARARVADALDRKAQILREQGDVPEADSLIRRSLEIREDLAVGPPSRRRIQTAALATTRTLAARIAHDRGDLDRAAILADLAVAGQRALAEASDDPETLSDVALAVSVAGDIALARGDEDGALARYLDALVLRQHVVGATDATRHRRALSVAWGRVGRVRMRLGDRVGARSAWERSWELMQGLVARDPGNVAWAMEASIAGCRWGDVAFADDELDLAERAWSEALQIRRQLAEQDPENGRWQEYLAVAIGRMARLHAARGDRDTALVYARWARSVSEQLASNHPDHPHWRAGLERARRRLEALESGRDPLAGDRL